MRANSPVVVDGDFGSDVVVSLVFSRAFELAVGKADLGMGPVAERFFAEPPQRQSANTGLVWICSPLELRSFSRLFTT